MLEAVLTIVRSKFYADRPNDYFSQRRDLMKAILKYAYICEQRGWDFDNHELATQIISVLQKVNRKEFTYIPAYLNEAITRHVNYRAEELNAKAKLITPRLAKIVRNTEVVQAIIPERAVETATALYKKLCAAKRVWKPAVKPAAIQQEFGI